MGLMYIADDCAVDMPLCVRAECCFIVLRIVFGTCFRIQLSLYSPAQRMNAPACVQSVEIFRSECRKEAVSSLRRC